MKRTFKLIGLEPAHGKIGNDFLKACDLGVEGAFVPACVEVTIDVADDATPEQLQRQPGAICDAFRKAHGWRSIRIKEVYNQAPEKFDEKE